MSIFPNNLRFYVFKKGLNLDEFEGSWNQERDDVKTHELGKAEPKFDLVSQTV